MTTKAQKLAKLKRLKESTRKALKDLSQIQASARALEDDCITRDDDDVAKEAGYISAAAEKAASAITKGVDFD
jgi:vacuolar-type H+-ATPase subunit H